MTYGPGNNALITNQLPPAGDTVEEAINKLDAQLGALYTGLNAAEAAVYSQYRGAWSSSTTYKCNDVVTSGSNTYICKNTSGAPAGTALTNATYWQKIAISSYTATSFATKAELDAGTVTNKAIAPNVAKQGHDEIKALITALTTRTAALETKTTSGTVNRATTAATADKATTATSATTATTATTATNATKLNNQAASYYRCSGCSWTCYDGCKNGCHNTCVGGCTSCSTACGSGCGSSCGGSCSNTCFGSN